MHDLLETVASKVAAGGQTPSAESWFAGGDRIGYYPQSRAVVASEDAPLRIFLRLEGDPAHAVSLLPGFPDGSFGWAKVRSYLPNATEMPRLFLDYVGMGDSDKPKDYAYSTSERADLVEAMAVMQEVGIDLTSHRSKHVDEFAGQNFEYVLTVCDNAKESCPVFFGKAMRLHRSFSDPAAVEGSEEKRLDAFRKVRDELRAYLKSFPQSD